MSSLDVRNNSAVMKRAEQLKRWEESDTNRQPPTPRPERGRKIKFSSGCVFLAACMSGDKEEVLKLLESGADINTANVDGLTALHQACIDDNLEMVEFLIEHGADINRQDNEGWTPLHATASCGFVSIARYLVEHGADPAAVNSDGDLAVDLAVDIQHLAMMDFMQKVMTEHNIDCEKARQAEEQLMLSDAKKWLRSDASEVDRPHPKTGATALHVAAAKGYTKVISLLLAGRANVDKQDNDGWTPLHAASHWGQKEAADMLVNAMADMDIRNYAGQTCIDVADRKMAKFLEELRSTSNKRVKRRPSSQIRISDKIENHIDNTPTKIIRVEVKSDQSKDQANDEKSKQSLETVKPSAVATTDNQTVEDEAPWRRNSLARARTQNESPTKIQVPEKDVSKTNNTTETSDVILRRTQSFEHDEKTISTNTSSTSITAAYTTSTPTTADSTTSITTTGSTTTTPSTATTTTPIRRSFVPPVRDEESETQRKAHAKRVRETRRSTQGVTLDEIKSAEELVKKKNSNMNNNNNSSSFKLEDASSGNTFPPNNSTIIPSAPAVIAAANLSSTISQRRINSNSLNSSNQSLNSIGRPVSAPVNATTSTTLLSNDTHSEGVSIFGRRLTGGSTNSTYSSSATTPAATTTTSTASTTTANVTAATANSTSKTNDDKDNDKENDNRNLAAQSAIQRRRKPKRRSTGVVHIDMDELDPERQDSANDAEEKDKEKESGGERGASRSRLSSTTNANTNANSTTDENKARDRSENGEAIDYKALWEAVKLENDKLKQQLKKKDDEIVQSRATLERFTNAQLEVYKTENQRLKEENGALIRVISKLSK
uniref:Protein phosphatase 1 regulatory subunit 12B n=1 Tax=Bactrocera dorsalis TaxID=27457 RepID=A0A034V5X0_BACDO